MPKTYYDSDLTGEKIGDALEAIDGVIGPQNNGKILYVTGGKIRAKSASQFVGGAVNSVNGKTGDVVLTASDIGALPDSTPIPTKTSDLTNDSGFITSSDLSPYRTAAVQDVIDDAQDDRLDDLEQATTAATVGPAPIVTFDASAADIPLKQVVVDIEPVQAGSGDPSPDNVRPISGWTGCNVTRTGKNLLDIDSVIPGAVDENTGAVVPNTSNKVTPLIGCEPDTTYIISGFVNGMRPKYYKSSAEYIGQATSTTLDTFTTPADCHFMRIQSSNAAWNNAVNPQLELGSIATNYEPYQGTVYPITFPTEAGTVYGGTLDVVNKRMTSEKQLFVFNGGEADIAAHATIPNWFSIRFFASQYSNVYVNNTLSNFAISNQFIQRRYADINYAELPTQNEFAVGVTNGYLRFVFRPVSIGTLEDFKAALIATPVQVLCNLINDVPFDIVAPDITTLLGENNIWADCGDVTVNYGAYLETLKASLDRTNGELDTLRACIAPIEDGATASQAYAADAYFFRNGQFCTALTAISVGAAFTLGTNYQTTTVAAALIALQS